MALRGLFDFFKFGRKLNKLRKHLQTESLPEDRSLIIGLASDAPAHKLCYELNRLLSLALKWENAPQPSSDDSPASPSPTLFEELPTRSGPTLWYQDSETHPDVEYLLTDGRRDQLPIPARPFRYFFMVRYLHTSEVPDLYATLHTLNQSTLIQSAVDLSEILPTNFLLL